MENILSKRNKNNRIPIPKIQDKDKSTSKISIDVGNKSLFPYNSKIINMSFLDEYLIGELTQEDERMTAEYFKLVTIDELIGCFFLLLTLASCFTYNETKNCSDDCLYDDDIRNEIIDLSLIFSSISTIFFLGNLAIRYYHYFNLYKNARYIESYENFYETSLLVYLIIEFLLAILHPNMLFKDQYFTTNKKYNLKRLTYNVNDILLLIQCLRLLYLIVIFVILSKFYSPRADRICKMMGKRLDLFFSFRALFINNTALMLAYCSIIICTMLAYMLKILSYPTNYETETSFRNFGNCFYFVIITMTTVGYGDMFPITTLGRVVGIAIGFAGTVVVALIVSFFNDKLNLENEEKSALDFLQRVNQKEEIMRASAAYFKENIMYIINKKKMEKGILPQDNINKKKLIKLVKRKIKARKRFKMLFHKFHIDFKMENDIDKINKKIDALDYVENDLSNYINLINIKIKDLIKRVNIFSSYSKQVSKKLSNEINIIDDDKLIKNKESDSQEIDEAEPEPEPQDSEFY